MPREIIADEPGVTLGQMLKFKRTIRGISNRHLSIKLGVSPSMGYHWETGQHFPDAKYIKPIAEFLEVSEKDVVWMIYQEQLKKGRSRN